MSFLDSLKDFWILITTPGTQMPTSTTIVTLIVIAAFTFIVPNLVQWRAYRRQNPMEDPKEKAKAAAKSVTKSQSSGKKSSKKKKKH